MMNGSGKRKYPHNDAAIPKRGDGAECCRCCDCCGRKSKGWLLLIFTFLALLFSVGTLASPWYLVYNESDVATLSAYYHWSGQLRVTRGHDGTADSTESLSWSDLHMPQTHTLFLTTLVVAVTALALVIILAGCVLCMILLPAYSISSRFILPRSGIRKAKWKWAFSLALLGCFIAQLLSFTLFLQLPQCFASDYDDHCSDYECANFIGVSRQKGGYMHIYTPFVGWCSAVISCMLVLVTAILFVAFFARKQPRKDRSHALAIINASDRSRSTTTSSMEPDDVDEDAAERRPLLASEKAESARRAANQQHESPTKSDSSILHHRSVSARVSPNKVEDATIEECDSPLSYHNPCPTSPSLARILPLADLPTSPNVTPRSGAAANLEARFAAAAADTVHSQPTIEEDTTQSEKNDLISEDNDTLGAKAAASGDVRLAPDRTPDSANSEPHEPETQKQSFEEEISAANRSSQAEEPSQVRDETISPARALADVLTESEAEIEPPSPAVKDEESGDKEAHSEEPKENPEESKTDSALDIKPAKRRFATMQRLSYKDYAKQKPAAPTPESILGPSRVRGVPTNRLAMRAATRGAPLSSMRSQVHAPPSPSRSATVPLPAFRKPADLTPQSETSASDELSASPDSSPTADTPPAIEHSAPSGDATSPADDTDIS